MFVCLLVVWNGGALTNDEALSGFKNPSMLMIGALFVVVHAIERSRLVDRAAQRLLGLHTGFRAGFLRLMIFALVLSAFLNNTPVAVLLIPVAQNWANARGFSPSLLLMPLSFSCILGGLLTMIGGGTNLVVQGLLVMSKESDEHVHALGFFEPAFVGLPLGILGLCYLLFMGPRLLQRREERGFWPLPDAAEDLVSEVCGLHCNRRTVITCATTLQDTLYQTVQARALHNMEERRELSLETMLVLGLP